MKMSTLRTALLLGALTLAAGLASPAFADKGDPPPPVVVNSAEVSQNVVMVKVQNMSRESATVNVVVDVMAGGKHACGTTPVLMFPGQKLEVPVVFMDPVTALQNASVQESGMPQ